MVQFSDRMTAGGIRRTKDGYAVFEARVARGGNVQTYLGEEMGRPDMQTVRVYRPADEVFKRDAMASFAGVPVTLGHPAGGVDAETWRDHAVGEVGEDVVRDGEFVRVPMILRDAAAIKAVEDGIRELSMGYTADLEFADGESPAGEAYDAIMSNFIMNHVAAVTSARGGRELRIGDGADTWGASPVTIADRKEPDMGEIKLRTVVVGDEAVNTTDEGARAIEKLKTALTDAEAAHKAAVEAKDEEIGKLKADLKTAQDAAKVDIDKLVADRAALVEAVKAIDASIDPAGKSDAALRKAAVAKRLGDETVADASDAEILGMFKAVSKDSRDPVADAIRDGVKTTDAQTSAQDAWAKSITDLNAWRKEA